MTKIVNIHKQKFDIYIGRENKKMHFGNPWSHLSFSSYRKILKAKDRDEAVNNFYKWIHKIDFLDVEPDRRDWIISNIKTLKNKILGCFCEPLNCHGRVLAQLADQIDNES